MSPDDNTLIALGLIQRPRGLSGELAVKPYKNDSDSFRSGLPVVIKTASTSLNTTIEYVKPMSHRLSVKFEGINTREEAEVYRNGELFCEFCRLPGRKDNEYFVFELVGLKVIDDSGEVIGEVGDLLEFPANDVFVIKTETGEILVPVIKDVIDSISLKKGFVKVNNIKEIL